MKNLIIYISIILLIISLNGCNGDNSKSKNNEIEENKDATINFEEKQATLIAEDFLKEFYQILGENNIEKSLDLFSDSVKQKPGVEALKSGLNKRAELMGLPKNFEILNSEKKDSIITVYTIVFSKQSKHNYEKLVLINEGISTKIATYEFSPIPYYDLNFANNPKSEVFKKTQSFYNLLNKKDFNSIVKMADESLTDNFSDEDLVKIVKNYADNSPDISSFKITNIIIDYQQNIGVIKIDCEAKTVDHKSIFDSFEFADRKGKLKIIKYQRNTNNNRIINPDITENEYGMLKKEAGLFYELLSKSELEKIYNKIDQIVKSQYDKNTIMNSFIQRNQYYGKPVNYSQNSHQTTIVSGKKLVVFSFTVENANQIKSAEKIGLMLQEKGDPTIYSYEYTPIQ
jgi:hypothetical protein